MRGRTLLTLGMVLMLAACQPPAYRILAHQEGYRLIFTARGSGTRPFRSDDGIAATRLTVRDSHHYLWAIDRDPEQPGCISEGRSPPFPLAYGGSAPCYRTLVEPQTIGSGTLYRVEGHGIRQGSGYFRYEPFAGGGRATNLDWDDVEAEVRGWTALPDLPSGDQVKNSTSAAPAAADSKAVSATRP